LNAVLVANVKRDAATDKSTENGEIWDQVGQAIMWFFIVLLAGLWADASSRLSFRPNDQDDR
jgi:hypothetical protein